MNSVSGSLGKGVSVAIPISSVMGLSLYQFMINNRQNRGDQDET